MDRLRAQSQPIIWIISLLVFSAFLVAASVIYCHYQDLGLQQEAYEDISVIADLKARQIREWRQERLSDIERIVQSPFVRTAVAEWIQDPSNEPRRRDLLERLELEEKEGYDDVLLLGKDGNILLSAGDHGGPLSRQTRETITAAGAEQRPMLSDFFRCSNDPNVVHLDAIAPIVARDGALLAFVVLRSDAEQSLYPLLRLWPTPSASGETLLVSADKDGVTMVNNVRFKAHSALNMHFPITLTSLPAVQAAIGREGRFDGPDYRGVEVISNLRHVPQTPWFMVSKVDKAEIMAKAEYRTVVTALFTALLILLACALAAYAYRRGQAQLYRALYRSERTLREASEEFRITLYSIGDAVITADSAGNVRRMNPEAERLTGWTESGAMGQSLDKVFNIINEATRLTVESPVRRVLREGDVVGLANHTLLISKDGTERPIADSGAPIRGEDGQIIGVVLVFRDQTDEHATMHALEESERRFRTFVEGAPMGIFVQTRHRFAYVNPEGLRIFGAESQEELLGQPVLERFHPEVREQVLNRIHRLNQLQQSVLLVEETCLKLDGTPIDAEVAAAPICYDGESGALVFLNDVTERKEAQKDRLQLEEQLRHAQRLESVGRLAGGVAHDFNNMLGVIVGYCEMALSNLDRADPLYLYLKEISGAAKRSTELTQQLLAFSRRQLIDPKVIDLNGQLRDMERLLRRILGEDIEMEFLLAPDLWSVCMDPSQVDQMAANLAVNSRDAMPDGGKLTVETRNVSLDEDYCQTHAGFLPGDFVMLAVSDTGLGMDKKTLEHVFEPFFTTKGDGKGTGLGLATVYGIVRQNNGFVNIYSEPNDGTTVRIYLARYRGAAAVASADAQSRPLVGGNETILLVEDQDQLRQLAKTMLLRLGYNVLDAAGPEQAIALCQACPNAIQLLLTDVVMPAMNGKELAKKLTILQPTIKTLFMSGYTANAIAHRGVLEEGIHFLQKPFSIETLAAKIREALDEAFA